MLKYEAIAKVGDRIRGYDFIGVKTRFIEGVVVARGVFEVLGCAKAYRIMIDNDSGDESVAKNNRVGTIGYVPMETMLDFDGRVVNLSEIN